MDAGNRGSFQAQSGAAAKASWPRLVFIALLLAAFCSLGLGLWAGSGNSQEQAGPGGHHRGRGPSIYHT